MRLPVLAIVLGTRSDILACGALLEAIARTSRYDLPFQPRLLLTGQEATEATQAADYLELDPFDDLEIKGGGSHLADAALNARLLERMEAAMRHHKPAAALVVGSSATAWATAVAAYFKETPLICLTADPSAPGARPFPEWLHVEELLRVGRLFLCADQASARVVAERAPEARVEIVGAGADEILRRSLASPPPVERDPTLARLRPDAPSVVIFIRRREHHAEVLRHLCQAIESLANQRPDCDFIVVYSLQSHICDPLSSLLPEMSNVRGVAPMPHPAFIRELSRARLVVTDSAGTARESLLLGRPLALVGEYSRTVSNEALAASLSRRPPVCAMEAESLERAIAEALNETPQESKIPSTQAGQRALEAILEWWSRRE